MRGQATLTGPMRQGPLVSIVIDNYNYGQYIRQAIDSALRQTYRPVEVIVVDDGSTDGSREIIASYGKLITPVFQENAGQPAAFNTGLRVSRGEAVILLDSDDALLSHAVSIALE